MNKSWICVGKILRPHGLKGELVVQLFAHRADWFTGDPTRVGLSNASTFTSEVNLKSFTCRQVRPFKKHFLMQLEGVQDRSQSERLAQHYLFIETSRLLVTESDDRPFLFQFLEAQVFDYDQLIGTVVDFEFNGAQDILVVSPVKADDEKIPQSQTVYEIPLVKPFIKKWDQEQKLLFLELPTGLLDINRK